MQLKKWHITVALICILAGILLAISIRLQLLTKINTASARNDNMVNLIEKLEAENKKYENEIVTLREQLDDFQASQTSGITSLEAVQTQIEETKLSAGLVAVEGPALTISVDDRNEALEAAKKNNMDINYWDYLVHDEYLLNLVNDLKLAGAEAISINGERIINTTDIKCGGFIVFINGNRIGAPYKISAIGDVEQMEAGLNTSYTYNEILQFKEYPTTLTRVEKLTIPAYKGSVTLNYGTAKEGL